MEDTTPTETEGQTNDDLDDGRGAVDEDSRGSEQHQPT